LKFWKVLFRIGTVAAAALVFIVNAQKMPAQTGDSEEISKLLIEAKSHVVLAEDDAASLQSFPACDACRWLVLLMTLNS